MAFALDDVVPWGRSFDEYRKMFNLSDSDLEKHILGCADGPAAFNSVMTTLGHNCTSCDPLYQLKTNEIRTRIDETFTTVMDQMDQNQHHFVWSTISNIEELGKKRKSAMDLFLNDFDTGKKEGRYINACLPELPFSNDIFDLALCSHFLFLYSEQLSFDFHLKSIKELCRVAKEVRIFPLLELSSSPSRYISQLQKSMSNHGLSFEIKDVPYEFQKNGNQMIVIQKRSV